MSYVLIFDIPRDMKTFQRRIQRELNKSGAKLIQYSVWKLNNLQKLIEIASWIKKNGGDARILEERFVF